MRITLFVCTLFGVCICKHVPGLALNKTLHLAYLMSWSNEWPVGPFIGSAIIVGIEEVRRRHLLDGYQITWSHRDTHCEPRRGMAMLIDIWDQSSDLDGIIGGDCSVVCQPVSLLAAAWGVPSVSYGCSSDALSDKVIHPTFSRSTGVYVNLAPMFVALAQTFNWTRVGLITDVADLFHNSANAIKKALENSGIDVNYYTAETSITGSTVNNENLVKMRNILKLLKDQVRIIIVFLYPQDLRVIHIEALNFGMLDGRYVFVGLDSANLVSDPPTYRPEFNVDLVQGLVDTTPADNKGPDWDKFRNDVLYAFLDPAFDHLPHIGPGDDVNLIESYAGMVHDAVLMWAYGVNKTLEQGYPPDDGFKVTENIFNLTFEGITGTVAIDEKGDRKPNYKIEMVQNGKMVTIMEWLAAEGRMKKVYKADDPHDWSGLLWAGNGTSVPRDSPVCGWNNEFCPDESADNTKIIIIVACVVSVVVIVLIIAIILGYRRIRYENDLREAISCCLAWDDVRLEERRVASRVTIASVPSNGSVMQTVFVETGKVKNDVVAIKKLGEGQVDVSDRRVLVELKAMKEIKHENVNAFIGVCLEATHACILMAYAPRGSLQDILSDEEVKLTWDLKLSLVTDIAQGMKYLHSTVIGSHGNLTSSNCVVDSRWACKITDYGLDYIKFLTRNGTDKDGDAANLLWTAPELLRMKQPPLAGTQKADVYSFAIVAQEIVLQNVPFAMNTPMLEAEELIEKIQSGLKPPYRPLLPQDCCSKLWMDMMYRCWNENPDARPTFTGVLTLIRDINGGKALSLVDNMINRLESHTRNLEDIVSERSKELQEEKHKMEILLQELLPKSVADNLKAGLQVAPESFEDVTIFFSDIVSFTRISAAGTPIDVVKMLNLMYTLFDDIAAKFDVYKVATIGDAYFVASGVPIRNEDKHAGEICGMALELLKGVKYFPVPHLPEETLKLRIGIHSGSCVAGVAGIKMPRYLLFGDTVDIASHMESGGESMRIHISSTTKLLLESTGGFHIEERGEQDIKGLGTTMTYWLKGRTGDQHSY